MLRYCKSCINGQKRTQRAFLAFIRSSILSICSSTGQCHGNEPHCSNHNIKIAFLAVSSMRWSVDKERPPWELGRWNNLPKYIQAFITFIILVPFKIPPSYETPRRVSYLKMHNDSYPPLYGMYYVIRAIEETNLEAAFGKRFPNIIATADRPDIISIEHKINCDKNEKTEWGKELTHYPELHKHKVNQIQQRISFPSDVLPHYPRSTAQDPTSHK